jgi:hypothetical protein
MSISKERDRRFQTAEAFRRALQNVAGSVLAAAPLPAVNQATVLPGRVPQTHSPAIVTPPALPPALPPTTPPRSGHRGLYMAVGGVAVLAVLALLAWQGPRFLRSSEAAPAASMPQTETAPATNPPATNPPAAAPETAAPQASAPTSITPTPEPAAQPATTTRASQLPRGTGAMPTPNTSAATQQPQAQSAPAPVTPSAPAPVAQQAQSSPAATPPANTQAAAQPAAAPGPSPAEVREQRQILMLLGTRARAVNTSLQTMRTEQARKGLNMRGDVTVAQQQMEFHLDEAESALKERDLDGAKKSLAAAERELERLEKLLGR